LGAHFLHSSVSHEMNRDIDISNRVRLVESACSSP
jgi:hypothetical protein